MCDKTFYNYNQTWKHKPTFENFTTDLYRDVCKINFQGVSGFASHNFSVRNMKAARAGHKKQWKSFVPYIYRYNTVDIHSLSCILEWKKKLKRT